jgi:MFS family permease
MEAALSIAATATGPVSIADRSFWKITLRLMPYLALLWCLAWIDRVNIGFAKLTMLDDLKFSEAVYGLGAGMFFLGYFFFEIPSNLLLQKIGARKTLMRITICWGMVCMAMMFVSSPVQFYIMRFLLGAFEAGFQPGVLIYLTYWYPSHRRAQAIGLFTSATAVSGIIGGPIAGYVMTGLAGAYGLAGWQWVFLLEGFVTAVAGAAAWWVLKEKPQDANWLTEEEKAAVTAELLADEKAVPNRSHKLGDLLSSSTFWILTAIYFCLVAGYATVNFFGPTAIRELGFTSPTTIGWIISACSVGGAIFQIVIGRHSDKHKEVHLHAAFAIAFGAISLALMGIFLGQANVYVTIACLFLAITGTASAFPVFWQIPLSVFTGTAAVVGVAAINSIANLAGFFAPTFLGFMKTATGTLSGGLLAVAAVELCGALLIVFVLRRNLGVRGPD